MSRFAARNLSLVLMLVAFALISYGTTRDQAIVWQLGLASLAIGALIPPVMRFLPEAGTEEEPHEATDLGESSRVC